MYKKDNTFARMVRGDIPVEKILDTESLIAIRDIAPQAPIHILIIPKKGLENVSSASDGDKELLGEMMLAARDIAGKLGIREGMRLVINEGEGAGQSVPHLHMHLLAGRSMHWPPG